MKTIDRDSLKGFNVQQNKYLAVVGKGSKQHLELRHIRFDWLGKFLRMLGLAYRDTNPRKLASYVVEHIEAWEKDPENFSITQRILGKIQKFHKKRPKQILNTVRRLGSVYNRMVARNSKVLAKNIPSNADRYRKPAELRINDTFNITPGRIALIKSWKSKEINALNRDVRAIFITHFSDKQIALIDSKNIDKLLLDALEPLQIEKLNWSQVTKQQLTNLGSQYKKAPPYLSSIINKLSVEMIKSIRVHFNLSRAEVFTCLSVEKVREFQKKEPNFWKLFIDKNSYSNPETLIWGAKEAIQFQKKHANFWQREGKSIFQKLDLSLFTDKDLQLYSNKASASQLKSVFHRLDYTIIEDLLPQEVLQQIDFAPMAETLSNEQIRALVPKINTKQLRSIFHLLDAYTIGYKIPNEVLQQIDFAPMAETLSNEQIQALAPKINVKQLVSIFHRLDASTIGSWHLSKEVLQQINLETMVEKLSKEQIQELAPKINAKQLSSIFHRLDASTIGGWRLSKELLQQMDFSPLFENLSDEQINALIPKLNAQQLLAMPSHLFGKILWSYFTIDQLLRLEEGKFQALQVDTWFFTSSICFDPSLVQKMSVAQIQKLAGWELTSESLQALGMRLRHFTLDQLFDCAQMMGEADWRNCNDAILKSFLADQRSKKFWYKPSVQLIQKILGIKPQPKSNSTPPPKEDKAEQVSRGNYELPKGISKQTFAKDLTPEGIVAHQIVIQIENMGGVRINELNLTQFYKQLLNALKVNKIERFSGVNMDVNIKSIYRYVMLFISPDKLVGNPHVDYFAELFKIFQIDLKPE